SPGRLCERPLVRPEPARAVSIFIATAIVGVPRFVSWLLRARWHLAVAHLGANWSRGCADGGLDVASRDRDETRRLRRIARGDESFSARIPHVEQMDRGSRRDRDCLCRSGGVAPERSEIRYRLFK